MFAAQAHDSPVARADPTPDSYALVEDVTTANFARMVDFVIIPGTNGSEAVVVSQTEARIRRVSLTGAFAPVEFGNLSAFVKTSANEEGLLSLAFSPNYLSDGRVYAYYTSLSCQAGVSRCARVTRFPVSGNDMNESMATVVLEIDQQLAADNHNGGRLLFGPDGYLYLSVGDGGSGGDPLETGQNPDDLLGSVLRINVTGQATYTVPATNPFVGAPGADEVWAYGLRNPWRYSFDRQTGALWLADVGQGAWEEVEPVVAGGNFGWDCYEGNTPYESSGCSGGTFQFPRQVYDHSLGCSVTGGYVYRGPALPELQGWYVYGDYCSGRVWAVDTSTSTGAAVQLVDSGVQISSFAELPNGELLLLTFQNAIYRLTCAGADSDGDDVGNSCDNCPAAANAGQYDADGDGRGDICDMDTDGDRVEDVDEANCGGNATNAAIRPERIDGPFAGVSDDGDGQADEALPAGSANYDCDGDGYKGSVESGASLCGNAINDDGVGPMSDDGVINDGCPGGPTQTGSYSEAQFNLGLNDQDPCGTNGWAGDLFIGGVPDSTNRVTLQDLTSFLGGPRRFGTSPGQPDFSSRWDLLPGGAPTWIGLQDFTALIAAASSTGSPPMLGGLRAFGSPWTSVPLAALTTA